MEVVASHLKRPPTDSCESMTIARKMILQPHKMSAVAVNYATMSNGMYKTTGYENCDRTDDEITVIEEIPGSFQYNQSNEMASNVGPIRRTSLSSEAKSTPTYMPYPADPEQRSTVKQRATPTPPLFPSTNAHLKPKRLADMKVPELKVELRKRNMPVSGTKTNLVERLKPFEKEVLGFTPPPSPEPAVPSPEVSTPEQREYMGNPVPQVQNQQQTVCISNQVNYSTQMQSVQQVETRPTVLPVGEIVQAQPFLLQMQNSSQQLMQLVDDQGNLVCMIRMPQIQQAQPVVFSQACNTISTANTITVSNMETPQQQQPQMGTPINGNRGVQTNQVVQQPDNTYRFAQMGSGGQFTASSIERNYESSPNMMSNNIPVSNIQMQPVNTGSMVMSNNNYPTNTVVAGVNNLPPPMLVRSASVSLPPRPNRLPVAHKTSIQTVEYNSPAPEPVRQQKAEQVQPKASSIPRQQHSPKTGDQALANSPNIPGTIGAANLVEGIEISDEELGEVDLSDPAAILTPRTLQMHEDMLTTQHKKIDQLEKEIAESQSMLRKQQQLILKAKKVQQKLREKERYEQSSTDQTQRISQNEVGIANTNKHHIQHYLQQKQHTQNLQALTNEHSKQKVTEDRLQEELHVDQAVNDIVRLIKQDPRTALLIVQLLRRYQLERNMRRDVEVSSPENQMESINVESPVGALTQVTTLPPPPKKQKSKPQPKIENSASLTETTQRKNNQTSVPSQQNQPVKKSSNVTQQQQPAQQSNGLLEQTQEEQFTSNSEEGHAVVDMEEIFKSVIQDASRAMGREPNHNNHVETIDCTISASMDSPRIITEGLRDCNGMVHQSAIGKTPVMHIDQHCLDMPDFQQTMVMSVDMKSHLAHDIHFDGYSGPPPSLDDVMDVIRNDANYGDHSFDDEYNSEDLAHFLGVGNDDWLSQDNTFELYQHDQDESGRTTVPMMIEEEQNLDELIPNHQNMDWLDVIIKETKIN